MTQAKAKSNSVVTTQWSGDILSITVLAAQTVGGKPMDATLMFDMTKASEANRAAAERHGWTQRICDKAAMSRDPKTGKPFADSAARKYAAMKALIGYYESGDVPWKMSGGGTGDSGLLLTALCRLKPNLSVAQVAGFIDSRTAEQMKAVRARRDVVEMMNQVRLERLGEGAGEDALEELDSWDGAGEEGAEVEGEIAELIRK